MDQILISLMSQYTPAHHWQKFPELGRRLSTYEYQKVINHMLTLGITHGYQQERSSAKEEYTPPFTLEGVFKPSAFGESTLDKAGVPFEL